MPEMPRAKTKEELYKQVNDVETILDKSIIPESTTKKDVLLMSEKEIKEKYPDQYSEYLKTLKNINNHTFPEETEKIEYSDAEINTIRDILSGNKQSPLDPILKQKADNDGRLKAVRSAAIWFPVIYDRVYKNNEMPKISILETLGRGKNACQKIEFKDQIFIVKPLESTAEKAIAQKASDLNVGPKQFESIEHHLTEEFVEGDILTKINHQKCTPEFMKKIGIQLGEHLKTLHKNNILVNDQILSDDFSRSHLIVNKDGSVKIIDFGASIDLTNFPDITDEEVFSLIRTSPGGAFGIGNQESMEIKIEEYRKNFLSKIKDVKELIRTKDIQLLNEGLHFLSQRLPNVEYLFEGLKESYII